jgi:hypothetical protein
MIKTWFLAWKAHVVALWFFGFQKYFCFAIVNHRGLSIIIAGDRFPFIVILKLLVILKEVDAKAKLKKFNHLKDLTCLQIHH